jgi:hypothetical protein
MPSTASSSADSGLGRRGPPRLRPADGRPRLRRLAAAVGRSERQRELHGARDRPSRALARRGSGRRDALAGSREQKGRAPIPWRWLSRAVPGGGAGGEKRRFRQPGLYVAYALGRGRPDPSSSALPAQGGAGDSKASGPSVPASAKAVLPSAPPCAIHLVSHHPAPGSESRSRVRVSRGVRPPPAGMGDVRLGASDDTGIYQGETVTVVAPISVVGPFIVLANGDIVIRESVARRGRLDVNQEARRGLPGGHGRWSADPCRGWPLRVPGGDVRPPATELYSPHIRA